MSLQSSEAHRQRELSKRKMRKDGRLVHYSIPGGHGQAKGYRYYGCRCKKCTSAHKLKTHGVRYAVKDNTNRISDSHLPASVTYVSVHGRLLNHRGQAKNFKCFAARCYNQAEQWAYNGLDPNEGTYSNSNGYDMPFGTSIEYYFPLCRNCHRAYDYSGAELTVRTKQTKDLAQCSACKDKFYNTTIFDLHRLEHTCVTLVNKFYWGLPIVLENSIWRQQDFTNQKPHGGVRKSNELRKPAARRSRKTT